LLEERFSREDDSLASLEVRYHTAVELLAARPKRLVGSAEIIAALVKCPEFLEDG